MKRVIAIVVLAGFLAGCDHGLMSGVHGSAMEPQPKRDRSPGNSGPVVPAREP